MYQSKLISFLKKFTKDELKSFATFVQSPYFSNNKKASKLYLYIRKSAPDFTSRRLDRVKAFDYLFPNVPFKEIKLQQVMSELVRLIER